MIFEQKIDISLCLVRKRHNISYDKIDVSNIEKIHPYEY